MKSTATRSFILRAAPRSSSPARASCLNLAGSTNPKQPLSLRPSTSALDRLADRLTRQNPQFSRNLANRVWFHLFARGIVEPVDDFRDSNPPSNPALLESITRYFEAHGMRLAPLVAWIMKSQTYQLSATPDPTSVEDEANFSHAAVRLLPAEVLLDAISQVLDVPEQFPNAPRSLRSTQLPGPARGVAFLKTFGKPDRLLTCECERSEATTLAQAFQMINGETLRRKLERGDNRLGRAISQGSAMRTCCARFISRRSVASPRPPSGRACWPTPSPAPHGGRTGKTSSGPFSTARNSCCGTDRGSRPASGRSTRGSRRWHELALIINRPGGFRAEAC